MLHRYLYGVAIGTVLVVSPVFFDASAFAASRHRSAWVNTQYICTYNRRGYRCGYVAVDARGFQFSNRSSAFNSASNNNFPRGNPGNAKPVGNAGESPNGRDFAFPPGIRGMSDSPSIGGGSSGGASFAAGGFAGGNPGVGPGGGGAPGLSGGGAGHGH